MVEYAMEGIHEAAGQRVKQLRDLVGSMGPDPAAAAAPHLAELERLIRADFHLHTDDPEVAPGDVDAEAVPWPKSKCRSCNAVVIWTMNASTGRRMPVDFEPVGSKGNLLLTHNGIDGGVAVGVQSNVLSPSQAAALDAGARAWLRVSHFATCPNAEQWRGKSKPKAGG